jgi:hypothetical protein
VGKRKAQARHDGVKVPSAIEAALDTALDKALAVQRPVVTAYLDRVRQKRPKATPAEVVEMLERRYFTTVVGIGGASGAAAALPGAGTAATVASGAAEISAFVGATALFALGLAELHSIPVSDPEVRRALVVAVLLGDAGAAVLSGGEAGSQHWAQLLGRSMAKERIGDINSRLGHLLLTRFGARQGALLFGRALPLGLGAGVGAVGNAALARTAIAAARRAFGPAPASFPPRVIDG